MEILKDGKYIIGFLIGVICSFVIMGVINKNNQSAVGDTATSTALIEDEQALSADEQVNTNVSLDGDNQVTSGSILSNAITKNTAITKPEDPHSPELQRLALILKETEKMVARLQADIEATKVQQTATVVNQ